MALAEEMMGTLKAATIAMSENAENALYTNRVQGTVKKELKYIAIHGKWIATCTGLVHKTLSY